jgi:putative peptide-modifying radical SAM enzyme
LLYFVVLTHRCNLQCSYCGYGEEDSESATYEVRYTVEELRRFIIQDPKPSIIFYGGEPLIRKPLMKKIMKSVPADRYLLQTNALNLADLEPEYLQRFDAILVSIDGRRETTDAYRGNGVYDRILDNLRSMRNKGFRGDLIARMTASEKTDIYLDVMHLLGLEDPHFNHVHWQLDALWDSPPERRWANFEKWIAESYNPGIMKLVKTWSTGILTRTKILPIVPFIGVMRTLLTGEKVDLRCGSGIDSFAVTTNGDITVCPIAPEWEFAKVGTIFDSHPEELPYKVKIGEPCIQCDIFDLCGGRCLFANKTKLWGENGFQTVCLSTRTMINELSKLRQSIMIMISRKEISETDFEPMPYNNGTEIIP